MLVVVVVVVVVVALVVVLVLVVCSVVKQQYTCKRLHGTIFREKTKKALHWAT